MKKQFFSSKEECSTSYRLVNNYEASYRTFKKIQLLILNAVQSVYESQGVSIANKHLEVIIKQMTTKVLPIEGYSLRFGRGNSRSSETTERSVRSLSAATWPFERVLSD